MKRSVQLVLAGLAIVVAMAGLAGCGQEKSANAAKKPETINMTYVKSPLNIPSIIEKKDQVFEKAFKDDGITITYSDLDAGPKQTEALAAGKIDVCHALGGTSAILARANGIDLTVVGVYSRAPEAFMIMTKDPSIQSVKDLKGKKIAGPKGTILHQLLLAALAKEGMSADDVQFVSMGIPQAAAALSGGSADAALLAGPATLKMKNDGARILTTGKGLLDATIVIAMRSDFIKQYPEVAKKFMQTHEKVVKDYLADPQKYYGTAAAETGLTEDQVQAMAGWYDFNPAITDADIEDLTKTQDFLVETGMLEKDRKI
ncbi:MAG: NrtA/SsuA/CpmA family ABC transporter substrate-binding protein, partial [Caecibacter massiliensis]|nr:NrtA/SsuA/CpmA family ABC transporter substrate-binding protein [Caecibacter massiliensis]